MTGHTAGKKTAGRPVNSEEGTLGGFLEPCLLGRGNGGNAAVDEISGSAGISELLTSPKVTLSRKFAEARETSARTGCDGLSPGQNAPASGNGVSPTTLLSS